MPLSIARLWKLFCLYFIRARNQYPTDFEDRTGKAGSHLQLFVYTAWKLAERPPLETIPGECSGNRIIFKFPQQLSQIQSLSFLGSSERRSWSLWSRGKQISKNNGKLYPNNGRTQGKTGRNTGEISRFTNGQTCWHCNDQQAMHNLEFVETGKVIRRLPVHALSYTSYNIPVFCNRAIFSGTVLIQ